MKNCRIALLISLLTVDALNAQPTRIGGVVVADPSIRIAAQRAVSDTEAYKTSPNGTTHALADLSYCRIMELRDAGTSRVGLIENLYAIDAEILRLRGSVGLPKAICDNEGIALPR